MARQKIHVSQEDIDQGCQLQADNCPVFHALARQAPPPVGTTWFGDIIEWSVALGTLDTGSVYQMPRSVERFVSRFDHGKPVKPFSFYLSR